MRFVIAAMIVGSLRGMAYAHPIRYDTPLKKACIKQARRKFPTRYVPGPVPESWDDSNSMARKDYYHRC